MRRTFLKTLFLCLLLVCGGTRFGIEAGQGNKGKFYIVGMGTAPDLITIRGVDVIRSADVILVGTEQERELWNQYTKNKDVWYCPDWIRMLYGAAPQTIKAPQRRALAEKAAKAREELAARIKSAVEAGKVVAFLQAGDPMMYGITLLFEMLPKDIPTEVVPGIGSFQAASAAVKMSPPYGYDTSGVVLTMADWPGRMDSNEKLMVAGSTMVFYTMLFDYDKVFAQLRRHYSSETPVAVVVNAGDVENQRIMRSTVGRFLKEVDYKNLPAERSLLLVGKFLQVGQARKDLAPQIERGHLK